MKLLEEKILSEGKALNKDILKVDSFINHQVDPVLMAQIGEAFAAHFKGRGITKVVTIESSGIAPALMTASALGVPMVILKKQPSQILNDNLYQTVILYQRDELRADALQEVHLRGGSRLNHR